MLDLVGSILWLYLFLKVFVTDVDRAIVTAIAPAALPLLDFRLLLYILVVVVFLIPLRPWLLYLVYVALFPLVVLFVKVPVFLFRNRSWTLLLGLLQTLASVLGDFRYNVSTKLVAFVAGILIIFTDVPALLIPSALYLAWLMVWSFQRRLRRLFVAPTFVDVQQRAIRRILSWAREGSLTTVGPQYLALGIEAYNEADAAVVTQAISWGIGLTKALQLWAYQLDRYRRSQRPGFIFNVISYTWVFVSALTGLFLLNLALLKVAPDQYTTLDARPAIAVLVYALGTMAAGTAGGLAPTGQWAYLLQLAGGIIGLLIIVGFFSNLIVNAARTRDDAAAQALSKDLREESRKQAELFQDYYAVTVDEAYERLLAVGAAYARIVGFIIGALPPATEATADGTTPSV